MAPTNPKTLVQPRRLFDGHPEHWLQCKGQRKVQTEKTTYVLTICFTVINLFLQIGVINISVAITIDEMVEMGVHFGHQAKKWNPKMAPYIYTKRNGVHIIDLNPNLFSYKTGI